MFISKKALHIFFVQVITLQLLAANDIRGQHLSEMTVTLQIVDARVEEVFAELERQTPLRFGYDRNDLPKDVRFTFNSESISVERVLSEVSTRASLKFERANNQILVLPAPKPRTETTAVAPVNRTISGKVVDSETGEGLIGAAVVVKEYPARGTVTDIEGNFSLSVPDDAKTLIFSYIGYESVEVPIGNTTSWEIGLKPDRTQLDEVVVIGYGTQRRELLTNAVSSLKIDEDKMRPVMSVSQLLEGRVPGVQVSTSSGNLGTGETIRVRGAASLSASNEPLYVVDGVPITNANTSMFNLGEPMSSLATLNLNDIESITILKDAASAAIYGSRGTNGVVVITTKSGQAGKSSFNVNVNYGVSEFPAKNKIKFSDSRLYLEVLNEGIANYNEQHGYEIGDAGYNVPVQNPFEGLPDTDWLDWITQRGNTREVSASFSGGNAKTRFYLGGSYTGKDGVIKTNAIDKYNMRLNISHEMFPWLEIGGSTSGNFMRNHRVPGAGIGSTIIARAVEQRPFDRPYKPNGEYYLGGTDELRRHNPMQILNEQKAYINDLRYLGSVYAKFKLRDRLTWKTSFNADVDYVYDYVNYNENHPYGTGVGRIVEYNRLLSNILTENVVTYNNKFYDIDVEVMAGHSFQKITNRSSMLDTRGFPSPSFDVSGVASEIFDASGSLSEFAMESYFGRASFSYHDKYILTTSLRTDGSSKFSQDQRWGIFPSVSVGWNVSEEPFMKHSPTDLKFRMSYGQTGNQEGIGYYAALPLMAGGRNYGTNSGIAVSSFGNPLLTWEKTSQFDVGVDLGVWNGRVNFLIDYYEKNTHDLLYNTPVHTTTGVSSIIRNIGSIRNRGIELGMTTHFNFGPVRWNTQFNISSNKNKITELLDEDGIIAIGDNRALQVGKEMGAFYIFQMEGIYQYDGEVPQEQYDIGVRAGDVKWTDVDGNNIINDNDRVVKGSSNPDFFGGWNNSFSYKGLQLDVFTTFMYGNDVYAQWKVTGTGRIGYLNASLEDIVSKRWTGPGTSNKYPRSIANYAHNDRNSDRWLEDGSFFRVRTVTLSYKFKPATFEQLGLKSLRVYAQADNLFLFTRYSGWDPEVSGNLDPQYFGMDNYSMPQPRVFSVGANIGF